MITSLIFLFALLTDFRNLLKEHRTLLFYLLVLTLSLNLFGSHIAERYLIYSFPYFAIIVSVSLIRLSGEKRQILKTLFLLLFMIQLIAAGKMFAEIFHKNGDFVEYNHQLLEKIPERDALTLVPYEFIFNEIGNRNIASYKGFEYYQVMNGPFTQQSFFERANKLNIKYIVISKEVISQEDKTFPSFAKGIIQMNPYYTVYYKNAEATILSAK
jgi:hypothetical protein